LRGCRIAHPWEKEVAFGQLGSPQCSRSPLLFGTGAVPVGDALPCGGKPAPEEGGLLLAQGARCCDTNPTELYKRETHTRSPAVVFLYGCIIFGL